MTCDNHRVRAINPNTGHIEEALYREDWFGPGIDAITFGNMSRANYLAEKIEWEFPDD